MVVSNRENFSAEFACIVWIWGVIASFIIFCQKVFIVTKFEKNLWRLERAYPFVEWSICERTWHSTNNMLLHNGKYNNKKNGKFRKKVFKIKKKNVVRVVIENILQKGTRSRNRLLTNPPPDFVGYEQLPKQTLWLEWYGREKNSFSILSATSEYRTFIDCFFLPGILFPTKFGTNSRERDPAVRL